MAEKLNPTTFEQIKATIIVVSLAGIWLGLSFVFPPLFIIGMVFIERGPRAFSSYGRYDGDGNDDC